jgi:hypothetical protein
MRLKNILITLVVVGLAGYGALKLYVFYRAKNNFQQIMYCAGMPRVPVSAPPKSRLFDYDHISASVFGPVGIKGLKIRLPSLDEEIDFGEVLLTYDYDGDLKTCPTPKHINFTIHDMTMNVSLLEKLNKKEAEIRARRGLGDKPVPELVSRLGYTHLYEQSSHFRALGYNRLTMDVSFDLSFDPENKQATFKLHEKINKLGNFNFSMTLANMAKNINSAVLGVKIKEAKLEYFDDSYISRLFKMFAKENNEDVATYRKQVIDNLASNFSAKQIKLGKDSVANLKTFLQDPRHLIMTVYPYEPVGIQSIKLYKPGDVPLLLNLQIYTK